MIILSSKGNPYGLSLFTVTLLKMSIKNIFVLDIDAT